MNRIEPKKRIYVADDDEIILEIMQGILEDDYDVECFTNGESCLQRYKELPAELVLLDVDMPGLDGLEVCRRLHDIQPQCPVMFVSSKTSNEERLAGYAAGGYDYIVKPCDSQELLAKMLLIVRQQQLNSQLEQSRQEASNAFMEAATGSGELGVLLQFAVSVFGARNYQQLAEQVLVTLQQIGGLKAGIFVSGQQEPIFSSCNGSCPPIEQEILAMLKEKGRIFEFSGRVQINETNVSVLIKNMPVDDNVAGRLKDHIPQLLKIASACVESIDTSYNLTSSLQVIETVQNVCHELASSEEALKKSMLRFTTITEEEFSRMENEVQFLLLTEEQENKLLNSYSNALNQARKSTYEANAVCVRIGDIVADLQSLL